MEDGSAVVYGKLHSTVRVWDAGRCVYTNVLRNNYDVLEPGENCSCTGSGEWEVRECTSCAREGMVTVGVTEVGHVVVFGRRTI